MHKLQGLFNKKPLQRDISETKRATVLCINVLGRVKHLVHCVKISSLYVIIHICATDESVERVRAIRYKMKAVIEFLTHEECALKEIFTR